MAEDHLQFLKERFTREFNEADEEFGGEFPLKSKFFDIEKFLEERTIKPSTPIEMKNELYNLLYELKECNMLAEKERDREQERDRRIQNMKSKFIVRMYKLKATMMMMRPIVKKHWFIYTTRKKLRRIKRNLLELVKDDSAAAAAAESSLPLDTIKLSNPLWLRRQAVDEIHGFDDELKKIKALLLEEASNVDGIKTIGIVGMSGVGKTTLARMVVNDQDCYRVFKPIIWVSHSRILNPSQIMRQLLEPFSYHHHDASLQQQLRELQNRLSNKKYLIVIDNVWDKNEWYSDLGSCLRNDDTIRLCHSLPKGGGGAIIVTSGLEQVATSMVGDQNLFRLEPLFNAEALWSMFMDSIRRKKFLSSDHRQRLSRMKDEIIDRCDGLPLAAKTLAEVISIQIGKEEYWSIAVVRKKFCFRFDQLDAISYSEAMKNVRMLPGVESVYDRPRAGATTIIGSTGYLEIARELGKLWPTELISVHDISVKRYMVLKLDLPDKKAEKKVKQIVSTISGVESVTMDMNEKKLTVVGNVGDPEEVISKLRQYGNADIISIGPKPLHPKQSLRHKNERIIERLKNKLTDLDG